MLIDPPPIVPRHTNHKRKLFLTSDEHYFHTKIIEYSLRPFPNVETMNKTLIGNHNTLVRPCDVTIHIGDFSFGHAPQIVQVLRQLNGHHCIMDGSHDRALKEMVNEGIPEDLQDKVTILPKIFEFSFNKHAITLLHYAMTRWAKSHHGALHFFGHSHGHHNPNNRSTDVGVDVQDFKPVQIEDLIQKTVEKQYFENHPRNRPQK